MTIFFSKCQLLLSIQRHFFFLILSKFFNEISLLMNERLELRFSISLKIEIKLNQQRVKPSYLKYFIFFLVP